MRDFPTFFKREQLKLALLRTMSFLHSEIPQIRKKVMLLQKEILFKK